MRQNSNILASSSQQPLLDRPLSSQQALKRVHKPYGCFQLQLSLILCTSFATLSQIVFGFAYFQDIKHLDLVCTYNPNFQQLSESLFNCTPQQVCNQPQKYTLSHYNFEKPHTIRNWVYDFDLLCPAVNNQLTWLVSIFFIAFLTSSIISLRIADIVGRKPIIIIGLITHIIIDILLVSKIWKSQNFLLIYMILLGIRAPMASHCAAVLQMQFGIPQIRSYLQMALALMDNITSLILPIFYYYIGDWRFVIYGNLVLLCLTLYSVTKIIPQSARYYIVKKRFDKAREVYEYVAKKNRRQMFDCKLEGEEETDDKGYQNEVRERITQKQQRGLTQMICRRNSPLFFPALFFPFVMFTNGMVFYGLILGLNKLEGSIFVNGIAIGSADVLAAILTGIMNNLIGRKKYYHVAWSCISLSFLLYFFFKSYNGFDYVIVWLGKFGALSAFAGGYLIVQETFPTQVRGTVVGLSTALAQLGSSIGPLIVSYYQNFSLIFAIVGFLCLLGTFFIHQTQNMKMLDTAKDDQEQDVISKKKINL